MENVALWAEVIVSSKLLVRCTIQGRQVDFKPLHLQAGTTVERSGDRGFVVVPAWLATAMELAELPIRGIEH
jgi:hypothetical protein